MNHQNVLSELLSRLEQSNGNIIITWDYVQTWDDGVLVTLLCYELIKPRAKAHSLECLGCEEHCFQEVHFSQKDSKRAFIICDEPEMQNQMGRIDVPYERLKQWKMDIMLVAKVIAKLLGLNQEIKTEKSDDFIKLGRLNGKYGRHWICLDKHSLSLNVNQKFKPLNEALVFEKEKLILDRFHIDDLINQKNISHSKAYTPSIDKRETRKQQTQAMYEDWKKEFQQMKRKYPKKSDAWISKQISKMGIAQDRSSETIRKNMK